MIIMELNILWNPRTDRDPGRPVAQICATAPGAGAQICATDPPG